jgi:glycosyltransferase involved in cell wall biosynthesis
MHVFSALFQGGAESQLERIILASDSSVEHVVVSLKNIETPLVLRLRGYGVKVLMCDMRGPLSLTGVLRLRALIKQQRCGDMILQCWMYHANLITWLAAIGVSVPIFWNIRRSLPPNGITGFISKICGLVSRLSDVKIFCNSASGIECHVGSGYRRSAFIYAPNGFDENKSSCDPGTIKEIGISRGDINVACVGRYDPIKGHRFLIEAFSLLESRLSAESWSKLRLYFIGRDIEEAKDIREALDRYDLADKVEFLGERSDISGLLRCFDIFCLPSLSEGFPNVLVEAMLAGLPCVATNVGDTEIILPSSDFLVEPRDTVLMAKKLGSLIEGGQAFRTGIGLENKNAVLERYTMEKALACYSVNYLASIEKISDNRI